MIKRIKLLLFVVTCIFNALVAQNSVNIGLLIQDKSEFAAVQGAELAVMIANKSGGLNGIPFRVITKSMEGPWGTGSKQAVSLVWDDKVCALIGSHDGRNAHLVEQASAKSITPFISAWTSDPTLSQAFIPWFFNCVPNDEQQAEAITDEIFKKNRLRKTIVITDYSYDSNQALKSYLKIVSQKGYSKPLTLNYDSCSKTPGRFLSDIKSSDAECIILLSGPVASFHMIELLKKSGISTKVYGSFLNLNENKLSEYEYQKLRKAVIFPDAGWSATKLADFEKNYKLQYGKTPGAAAAFSFEATNVLIEAIRVSGNTNNDKITQALSQQKYEGITGKVQFDNLGIRRNACFFNSL